MCTLTGNKESVTADGEGDVCDFSVTLISTSLPLNKRTFGLFFLLLMFVFSFQEAAAYSASDADYYQHESITKVRSSLKRLCVLH